jgi:hypothetical protein
MKATLTWLAAILVSTLTLNAASAQNPYPVPPPGYGYPGYGPGETTSNYGGGQKGCAGGNCGSGGCATCGGNAGGKHVFLEYLKCAGCPGCQKPQLFKKKDDCGGKCGGMCGAFKGWLCRPCPSDAPVLKHAEYPLGFPNHPYVRSPRDYFMHGDQ